MVKSEQTMEPRLLPIRRLDGQSFTIINIEKIECAYQNTIIQGVNITTKEKIYDAETNTQHNKFLTTRKYIVLYLTKKSTLAKLKKNGSIGPFGCAESGKTSTFPPFAELYNAITDRMGKTVLIDPVLTADSERKEIADAARFFHKAIAH